MRSGRHPAARPGLRKGVLGGAKAGISLPHSSSGQKNAGTQISVSAAQPGDILWKSGHVGIYIGGGKYIHAPNTGDVVKISSVSGSGFVCAVRVK